MSKGIFITLEGPEGSGKTTRAANLVKRLASTGIDVVAVREPGGTAVGEKIRSILSVDQPDDQLLPEAELFLFEASRSELVRKVILPALAEGGCVVADRFYDSTIAYQGYGRGFDVEELSRINSFAVGDAVPDLTLLLDLDISRGFERIGKRNEDNNCSSDRIENEERDFHERVRSGYLEMASNQPDRFRIIDALKDEESVDAEVWSIVKEALCETG